jgi:hypothetical protein
VRKLFLTVLTVSFLCSNLYSTDYATWRQNQKQAFEHYKKNYDTEFKQMLQNDWQAFQTYMDNKPYQKPKPIKIPKTEPKALNPEDIKKSKKVHIQAIDKIIPKENVYSSKTDLPKVDTILTPVDKNGLKTISFDFFSIPVIFHVDESIKNISIARNNDSIAAFWDKMSQTKYQAFIQELHIYKTIYNLNDWSLYLLSSQAAQKLLGNSNSNNDKVNLFNWFVFSKMGYDTRVSYNDQGIYFMAHVKNKIYATSYYTYDAKRYYALGDSNVQKLSSVYSYKGDYAQSSKAMNFAIKTPVNITDTQVTRTLNFTYNGQKHEITVPYSKTLVKLYDTHPHVYWSSYYNIESSPMTARALLSQLKVIIDGKTEVEAVNMLLRFVQYAFAYKTDQDQFNTADKVLLPEQIIYYPYSDCEDRSVMFTYLVEKLLGLQAVGILYGDHMAAGVAMSTNVSGDSFMYKGKKFMYADPTWNGYNIGRIGKDYLNKKFSVMEEEENNTQYQAQEKQEDKKEEKQTVIYEQQNNNSKVSWKQIVSTRNTCLEAKDVNDLVFTQCSDVKNGGYWYQDSEGRFHNKTDESMCLGIELGGEKLILSRCAQIDSQKWKIAKFTIVSLDKRSVKNKRLVLTRVYGSAYVKRFKGLAEQRFSLK